MHKKIMVAVIILLPFAATAQLNKFITKARDKVNQRIDNKADKGIDKTLDQIEGKPTPVEKGTIAENKNPVKTSEKETIQGYSKFDFVPGERIIYAEDFSQDAIGELPLTWNASGKGEVMTINNQQGKWLRVYENNTYLTGNRNKFSENYTIEFDLMFFFEPRVKGYVLPGWTVGLLSSGELDPTDNTLLKEQGNINNTEVHFAFGSYALARLESRAARRSTFQSDKMEIGDVLSGFNKVLHYSIQVQKSRFRLWIDERKVFDIPRAMNTVDTMNQIYFQLESSNYQEDEVGLFISNIKIATGLPDTRHKLVDEGKFSTTGILFAVNAATIRPESYGVMKEVAEAIKSNPGMKVKIIGHTDSDGTDANNLELSKKRSEAVKAALVKDFGIDASMLETDGKGESQAVGDNKTREGKAMNRRVDFVKL
jgi:OmpA-OmpF porin, OOP family